MTQIGFDPNALGVATLDIEGTYVGCGVSFGDSQRWCDVSSLVRRRRRLSDSPTYIACHVSAAPALQKI